MRRCFPSELIGNMHLKKYMQGCNQSCNRTGRKKIFFTGRSGFFLSFCMFFIKIMIKQVFFSHIKHFTVVEHYFCDGTCIKLFYQVKIHHTILDVFYQLTLISRYVITIKSNNCFVFQLSQIYLYFSTIQSIYFKQI